MRAVLCDICNKEFSKYGIKNHIRKAHTEEGREQTRIQSLNHSNKMKGCVTWNTGLKNDPRCAISRETRRKIKKAATGKKHTEKTKEKLSKIAVKNGLGGVTQSRWIEYKGKKLGSSYELEVAKELDKHNVKWDTCSRFRYVDPKGKKRTYTPDFYLPEYDLYLDPKNDFLISSENPALGFKDTVKIRLVEEQNDIRVLILDKTQLSWDAIQMLL